MKQLNTSKFFSTVVTDGQNNINFSYIYLKYYSKTLHHCQMNVPNKYQVPTAGKDLGE
jgi:hypothetical protein